MMIGWLKKVFRIKPKKEPRVKMYSEIQYEQIDGPPFDYTDFQYHNPSKKEEPSDS